MADKWSKPPFNRPDYSRRWVQRGAEGVLIWHRRLAGRTFWFTLIYAGWWGVGETGELIVRAERPGLETYGEYRYEVRRVRVSDVRSAEAALRARWAEQP